MQGNGTFTVAEVFRVNATNYNQAPLWLTGTSASTNTLVDFSYVGNPVGPLELDWTNSAQFPTNKWKYLSAFTPTTGSWYFVACTVKANGATPIAHMWTGIGGSLVDVIAGV